MVHGEYGDLINANEERWHRATSCPNTGRSIRMAITPRSKEGQVHYFQIDQPPGIDQMKFPALLALLLFARMRLAAEEFSIHTVDGLDRPVAGVQVEVECVERYKNKAAIALEVRFERRSPRNLEFCAV